MQYSYSDLQWFRQPNLLRKIPLERRYLEMIRHLHTLKWNPNWIPICLNWFLDETIIIKNAIDFYLYTAYHLICMILMCICKKPHQYAISVCFVSGVVRGMYFVWSDISSVGEGASKRLLWQKVYYPKSLPLTF